MPNLTDTFLSGGNIDFIEGLYARYLDDPSSVDPSWREIFDAQKQAVGTPVFAALNGRAKVGNGSYALQLVAAASAIPSASMQLQARVDQTFYAFRLRGHMLAQIDPLNRPRPLPDHIADFGMVSESHFSPDELEEVVNTSESMSAPQAKLKDLLAHLRTTYCGPIGVEYMQILNSEQRRWLSRNMEHSQNRTAFSKAERKQIFEQLCRADGFETTLAKKYAQAKRFSLDGGDSLIPMVDAMLERGADLGVSEVLIGMAHRGRLNVLTNILGKSAEQMFAEFEGQYDPQKYISRGDVKYHMGFSSDHLTKSGKKIHLSMAFNPSHLEVVDPVLLGRARAKQERAGDQSGKTVLPLLIHGDAAYAGQGIVPETANLARLAGYGVGGTLHLVVNNQVGFTTDPEEARSSMYATQMAQVLDVPIFHVNGDDPEACVHVMRLATEYRQRFGSDAVVDLVCFRRYGHNENDEPSYTQPLMYEIIRKKPTVRKVYGDLLTERGVFPAEEVLGIWQESLAFFDSAHARVKKEPSYKEVSFLEGLWSKYQGGLDQDTPEIGTGVPKAQLVLALQKLSETPLGFTPHPGIKRTVLDVRQIQAEEKEPLRWASAEQLAYATLLSDGFKIRLTGQDTQRGTFTHRHSVLHDVKTGELYEPLKGFAKAESQCAILNSPLSEMGCLGFEFGYSLDYPDALVIWEAQFGDFANNAQVIIDQFIAAAEAKWSRLSGLTLFLPHGYEGQGPEHSSARLERFLELCGQDNIQVCYPTTPAQIFHLLRRQVIRPLRKPLVIMSPKSMLRRPEVTSTLDELATGRFWRFIPPTKAVDEKKVERLLLCSGKVYWDLVEAQDAKKVDRTAIARVEQLYPFPAEEIKTTLQSFPKLKEVVWVQEEPQNMGSWRFVFPQLQAMLKGQQKSPALSYVGRVESASPATGSDKAHKIEQQKLLDESLAA